MNVMMDRMALEVREAQILAPGAGLSKNSRGRQHPLASCPFRTEYQRDRDRIIHCKSFRRLKYKTQVYLPAMGDHFRTRLTHTLEVAQISRTIARVLALNEDLTEAIALGHDLGHTPFGHAGERSLNDLLPFPFHHNEQSLRVVDLLERDGEGLNLTFEVRDGILHHTGKGAPCTLEGQIVRISDRIAYVNHDIDDSLRSGFLHKEDLPSGPMEVLGDSHGVRIDALVADMVAHYEQEGEIGLSAEKMAALLGMRQFLTDTVYLREDILMEEARSKNLIRSLFSFYQENPQLLPANFSDGDLLVRIKDYIAGMTDIYALRCFMEYFVPKGFHFMAI